jgi:hypothetical protein
MVSAQANIVTRQEFGPALADEDAASRDCFTIKALDTQSLRTTITPIAAAAATFLVCH